MAEFSNVSVTEQPLNPPTEKEWKKAAKVKFTSTRDANNQWTSNKMSYTISFNAKGEAQTPVVTSKGISRRKGVLEDHYEAVGGDANAFRRGWVVTKETTTNA